MTLKFKDPGYVYIMSNESLNYLKIGFTQNSPYDRAAQLYDTGLPTPFTVEKFFFVEDAPQCEELVHMRLNRFRVNNEREFFRVDVGKAERAVEQAIDDLRERLWAKGVLKNDAKNESSIVIQYEYNNPKFTQLLKYLKETKWPQNVDTIAKELKISPSGVDKLLTMMGKEEGKVLYIREENKVKKYSISLGFNVQQLTLMAEKYPDLKLMELAPLFEKPKNNNSNEYKPKNASAYKGNNTEKKTFIPKTDSKPQEKQEVTTTSVKEPAIAVNVTQKGPLTDNKQNKGSSTNNEKKPKKNWSYNEETGRWFMVKPDAQDKRPEVKEFLQNKVEEIKNKETSNDVPVLNNASLSKSEKDRVADIIKKAQVNYNNVIEESKRSTTFKPR